MSVFFVSKAAEEDFKRRYPILFGQIVEQEHREARSSARTASVHRWARAPWSTDEERRARIRDLRREFIPCPKRLHKSTYRRLLRRHDRVLVNLDVVPYRRTWLIVRKRVETQLLNRLYRIRRRLG